MKTSSTNTLLAAFVALAGSSIAAPALADASDRKLTVHQTTVMNIKPAASSLKVDVSMDHEDGLYRPGDIARIFIKTNEDAWVTVVNVDADGDATKLFPNAFERNNKLRKGRRYEVCASSDCDIQVSAPYGQNLLKVIASSSPKPVIRADNEVRGEVFASVEGGASVFARNLSVIATPSVSKTRYAVDSWVFSVVPGYAASSQGQSTLQGSQQVVSQTTVSGDGSAVITTVTNVGGTLGAAVTGQVDTSVNTGLDAMLNNVSSDFGLEIRPERGSYRQGEKLRFTATAEKTCELDVYSINANGTYNAIIKGEKLSKGKSRFFPEAGSNTEITVSGSPGTQRVLAMCNQGGGFFAGLFGRGITTHNEGDATVDKLIAASKDNGKATARAAVSFSLSAR